jgi:hypothetical protein
MFRPQRVGEKARKYKGRGKKVNMEEEGIFKDGFINEKCIA